MALGAILNQTFNGYTKEETINDTVKLLYGVGDDATPADLFVALKLGESKYLFNLTVLMPNGQPWPNLALSGVTNVQGGPISTDQDGKATVLATTASPTVTATSNYIDLANINQQINKDENLFTSVTITGSRVSGYTTLTTSGTWNKADYNISPVSTMMDFTAVGGGGGGYGGNRSGSSYLGVGGGGGGGYVTTRLGILLSEISSFNYTIGTGGRYGNPTDDGENGGQTIVSFSGSSVQSITANGGNGGDRYGGGRGNGAGGYDSNGGNGTGYIFNESNLGLAGGGGGAAGANVTEDLFSGGSPYGANGSRSQNNRQNGRGPGGGGAGESERTQFNYSYTAGSGADGVVYYRFR